MARKGSSVPFYPPVILGLQAKPAQAGACLDAAERRGFDAAGARDFVLASLADGPTRAEVLVNAAKAAGFVPKDDRAFGGVFLSLSRKGLIQRVGVGKRSKGHGTSGGLIWALA
jgi:hypothetical protein